MGARGAVEVEVEVEVVGRDRERERFDQLLARLSHEARGGVLAFPGDPGIGKTRLLATLRSRAEVAGLQLLGGPRPDGRTLDPDEIGACAAAGADTGGVVVCLDDLHQLPVGADPIIADLLRLAASSPVLLAVAYRPRQLRPPVAALLAQAETVGALWRVPLAPLTPTEAGEVVGDHPDRQRIVAAGGGNPLYLRMLMESTSETAGPLLSELAALGAEAQMVAQVAATLGDRFPLELMMAACPLADEAVAAGLDALVAADLVRRPAPGELTFRHPVVARAIYDHTPAGQRHATHLRIDATLAERGGSPVLRAPHLLAAGAAGTGSREATQQVDTLLAAARFVLASDPVTAAAWAKAALEMAPSGDQSQLDAQLLVARAQLLSGEVDESRTVLQFIPMEHRRAPGSGPAAVASVSASAERLLGHYPEAETLARDGLAAVGSGTEQSSMPLHCELASIAIYHGDNDAATQHAALVTKIASDRGDGAYEACGLASSAWAHANAGDLDKAASAVTRAARRVDGLPDSALTEHLECLFELSCIEALVERHRDALRHAARGVALCRRTGQLHLMASLLMALADAQLLVGELAPALTTFDEAAYYAAREEAPAMRCIIAVLRAHTRFWLETGSPDSVVAEADQALADSRELPRLFAMVVQSIAGSVLVSAGDHERGRRLLLTVGGGPELPDVPALRRTRMWESLAVAALAAGDPLTAEHHADVALRHMDDVPLSGVRGFVERTQVVVHGARRDLIATAASAADHFTRVELWLAAGLNDLAAANAGLDAGWHDDPDRAGWLAERLAQAREIATRCGSPRLAAQVDTAASRQASAAGGTEPRWARPLTTREREIACLASAGITSAEIARRLYLSIRTVDNHLGRIYRKLDINNRATLTHLVVTDGRGCG